MRAPRLTRPPSARTRPAPRSHALLAGGDRGFARVRRAGDYSRSCVEDSKLHLDCHLLRRMAPYRHPPLPFLRPTRPRHRGRRRSCVPDLVCMLASLSVRWFWLKSALVDGPDSLVQVFLSNRL